MTKEFREAVERFFILTLCANDTVCESIRNRLSHTRDMYLTKYMSHVSTIETLSLHSTLRLILNISYTVYLNKISLFFFFYSNRPHQEEDTVDLQLKKMFTTLREIETNTKGISSILGIDDGELSFRRC